MDIDLTSDINNGELDNAPAPAVAPPPGTVPATGTDAVASNAQTTAPVQATEPAKTTKTSLRDQLSSAFKGGDGNPTDQAAATDNTGQPRGPDGKFAPKDTAATSTAAGVAAPEAGAQATDTITPPTGLSSEDATKFAALPVEMQQFVARTVAGVNEAAERYRGYDQLEAVIGERRQAWAINGMSEAQAVNQLLALSDYAGRAPADFVRWFSGQHGIDLAAIADNSGELDVDPVVAQLKQQVDNLTGQLTQLTQGQQQDVHNARLRTIEAFATEKGADNQPLRPYFGELGSAIVPVIAQVKAENPNLSEREILAEAYDRACWAHPTVRAKVLAAQEAARLEQQRVASARSQNAAASVGGEAPSVGSSVPRLPGNGSIRDTLRAQFNSAQV